MPNYVMPLIRQLCAALEAPAAAPHVYAGVQSVLKAQEDAAAAASPSLARRRGVQKKGVLEKRVEEGDVPALVVVVLMYAITRLSGKATNAREHQARRKKAVDVLVWCEACEGKGEEELVDAVDGLLVEAKERGWLEMEWFGNIVEGSGLEINGGVADEDEDVEMEDARAPRRSGATSANAYTPLKKRRVGEDVGNLQASVSQGGLGTMMQDKVDYLSEARRAEFLSWKAGILKRVEQIEREDGQAMDVSA